MKHLECALGKGNQIWKYLLVLLVTFLAASFIGSIPLLVVYMIKAAQSGNIDMALDVTNLQAVGISSNLGGTIDVTSGFRLSCIDLYGPMVSQSFL